MFTTWCPLMCSLDGPSSSHRSCLQPAVWPVQNVRDGSDASSQVRGELWRVLRYKCHLAGIRLEWQQPRKTSQTCPHCANPACTYRSPEHREKVADSGAWLVCSVCGWSWSRDYATSLNISRLGPTFITHSLATTRYYHASIADKAVKPLSYMGSGSALRLPPMVPRSHLLSAGRIYVNGWKQAVTLRSSYPTETMLRLCGSPGSG